VMAARAGTPLEEIEAALALNNQMLTFEPMDHRPLLGASGVPTIGGVFAGNISGPRRISAGAARDNLLGVRFVNGSGEIIKSGGRVMKNVTGLDLVKLMAGSWGTLGVLCEVIFKVLPKPETAATIAVKGLNDAEAAEAMAAAMGMSVEVSGAAHLPESVIHKIADANALKGGPATVLRLEGLEPSVAVRRERLVEEMRRRGEVSVLDADATTCLWRDIRDVKPFAGASAGVERQAGMARLGRSVRRSSTCCRACGSRPVSMPFMTGREVSSGFRWKPARRPIWFANTSRRWAAVMPRWCAPMPRPALVPVFEPQPAVLEALSKRIKEQFDPRRHSQSWADVFGDVIGSKSQDQFQEFNMSNQDQAPEPRQTDRWLEPGKTNLQVIYILYLASFVIGITGLSASCWPISTAASRKPGSRAITPGRFARSGSVCSVRSSAFIPVFRGHRYVHDHSGRNLVHCPHRGRAAEARPQRADRRSAKLAALDLPSTSKMPAPERRALRTSSAHERP
jgi:glycolate oxidase FAD binding subunit